MNYADLTPAEKARWEMDNAKQPGPKMVTDPYPDHRDWDGRKEPAGDPVSGRSYELVGAETKDTNPKDAQGSARVDMTLISPFALAEEALAYEEGGSKYGYFNYTIVGVKSRVYIGALLRHVFKWLMGEDRDPKTGVHHLGSARACLGILIDAQVRDKLFDDRPPSHRGASNWLDAMEARVRKVREVFKSFRPRHYTIKDTEDVKGTGEPIHRERAPSTTEVRISGENAQSLQGRDR